MALLVWETCFTALVIGWLGLCIKKVAFAPLAKLPGPWYTLFTDLWLMYTEFAGHRRVYIHELHQRFGSVVRLGPNEVSFTSFDALKEIYQNGGGYDKTEFYNLFQQYGVRTTFSSLGKAEHTPMKRNISGPYAKTNIMHSEVLGGIHSRARAFTRRCQNLGKEALDVYIYLHCYAMDCASFHLLHPLGTQALEGDDLKIMKEYSFYDDRIRKYARYRWPTMTALFERILKPANAPLANQYVLEASENLNPGAHSLACKLRNSGGSFTQIQIAAECMNHLAAGIDTTGDALCFLMYQLSLPQSFKIQERLTAELLHTNETPLDDLPYLEAVVKEGLRCFPPIPMSQPRYVPDGGREIDGFFMPAGVIVSCQAWSVHQLNEHVFLEGDKFLPERWLDPRATIEMNKLFFTFSAGGRICSGRHLALMEMKCLLREVYTRFKTRIAPELTGSMALSDQAISTRPWDQTCKLLFEPLC